MKQVFRECLISAALVSMGQNWGGGNMDLRVWLAQMCAKLEHNRTRIDNFGKMTLT